jgi:hypothetical protein
MNMQANFTVFWVLTPIQLPTPQQNQEFQLKKQANLRRLN